MPTLEELRATAQERLSAVRMYVDDSTDADVRLIADFLTYVEEQEAKDAEDLAYLNEFLHRRANAALADWESRDTAAAAVTTAADIDRLSRMSVERGRTVERLASAHSAVWHDFRVGRCGVCGMTKEQAAEAAYDCKEEC